MADPFTLIRVTDTETTGMNDPAEMVEIGWTDIRLFPTGWGIESGPHSRLVNPGLPISFGAMAVHHITQAEAETGISPEEARRLVKAGADVLCAHNAAFDSRFIPGHDPAWICTYKAAKTAWPDLESHTNGAIRYARNLVAADDPRAMPSHRAGPDTWVTAHILLDLLKEYSLEKLLDIASKPVLLLKINFGKHEGLRFSEIPFDYLDFIVNKSDMRNDPKKEDVVFTAREEIRRRASSAPASQPPTQRAPVEDPDAWRSKVGSF